MKPLGFGFGIVQAVKRAAAVIIETFRLTTRAGEPIRARSGEYITWR